MRTFFALPDDGFLITRTPILDPALQPYLVKPASNASTFTINLTH